MNIDLGKERESKREGGGERERRRTVIDIK